MGNHQMLAAMIPGSSAAATNSGAIQTRRRLDKAIALHDRAEAECERFDREEETPARNAFVAALEACSNEAPPPHEESATTFVNVFGDTVRLSTDGIGSGAVARKVVNDPTWADMGDEAWRQAHREIVAAHHRRDAILAEQAARRAAFEKETRAAFRLDAIVARSNSLSNRRHRLLRAALTIPAASLADILTKLDFIDRTIGSDEVDGDVFAFISSDIRILAGEA